MGRALQGLEASMAERIIAKTGGGSMICDKCGCDPDADLRALLREAWEELRRLEWSDHRGSESFCPICCQNKRTGIHGMYLTIKGPASCSLAALLAKLEHALK
jgi:hypothetical protein